MKTYIIFIVIIILIASSIVLSSSDREHFGEHDSLIKEYPDFLTSEECDQIRRAAEPNLEDSLLYASEKDTYDSNIRISKQAWIKDGTNQAVDKLTKKTCKLLKLSPSMAEDLQVVKYNTGGFFTPHIDACEGSNETCARMNTHGPRYATFLVYLNDDFEGGETYFPYFDYKVIPKKGKGVLFFSTRKEDGSIIKESLHGGNPVTKGIKWVCNKWYHLGNKK